VNNTLREEGGNFVTQMQAFEYWVSHNIFKLFQSAFGMVMCIPGCNSMFRISALVDDRVLSEISHTPDGSSIKQRNLLDLGEDRYLSILIIQHLCARWSMCGPRGAVCYIPEAICKTNVPDTWNAFIRQRRRWVNSTYICCLISFPRFWLKAPLPVKLILLFELFMVYLPVVSLLYIWCIIIHLTQYSFHFSPLGLEVIVPATITIPLLGVSVGLLIVAILVNGRENVLWYGLYFALVEVNFMALFPFYSFWRLDDFSWGTRGTRVLHKLDEPFQ